MRTLKTGQQGVIALIWLYGLGTLVIIAALTGLVKLWGNYTDGLIKEGHDAGVSETDAAYLARDNKQLQAVLVAQRQAQDRAAKAEADAAKAQAVASSKYSQGVKDGQARTNSLIASNQRLRDPGAKAGTCPTIPSPDVKTETAASGPASNAGTGGELSKPFNDFLLNLTGEADQVVSQLQAAQAVIVSDRILCNAP